MKTERRRRSVRKPIDSAEGMESPGLLDASLGRIELNMTMELYLRELLGRALGEVEGVVLYGSALLDDLSPSHGDIDLLVGLVRPPGAGIRGEIETVHRYLATDLFQPWGRMLEAYYLSPGGLDQDPDRAMLRGAAGHLTEVPSRRLGPLGRYLAKVHGKLLFGEDFRGAGPPPAFPALLGQLEEEVVRDESRIDHEDVPRFITMYTGMARSLYLVQTRELVSKSEACRELARRYPGVIADGLLEASRIRRGESYSGPSVLRRGALPFLEAVRYEVERLRKGLRLESSRQG